MDVAAYRPQRMKKQKLEDEMNIFFQLKRTGDSLFQEFETLNFERHGYRSHAARRRRPAVSVTLLPDAQ